MIVLLSIISLFLIYLILNIKNKMDNFMIIYDDEQNIQEENLKKTFKEIDKNNSNLETLIELNVDKKFLLDLGSNIDKNTNNIQSTAELLKNNPINTNNNEIIIGSNNGIRIGSGYIDFNLSDYNLKVCNRDGEECSFVNVPVDNSGSEVGRASLLKRPGESAFDWIQRRRVAEAAENIQRGGGVGGGGGGPGG